MKKDENENQCCLVRGSAYTSLSYRALGSWEYQYF